MKLVDNEWLYIYVMNDIGTANFCVFFLFWMILLGSLLFIRILSVKEDYLEGFKLFTKVHAVYCSAIVIESKLKCDYDKKKSRFFFKVALKLWF